jgi:hypothetical protein
MSEVPGLKAVHFVLRVAKSKFECMPSNTKKKPEKFNTFFVLTSHENLQTQAFTILPTGMSRSVQTK